MAVRFEDIIPRCTRLTRTHALRHSQRIDETFDDLLEESVGGHGALKEQIKEGSRGDTVLIGHQNKSK